MDWMYLAKTIVIGYTIGSLICDAMMIWNLWRFRGDD